MSYRPPPRSSFKVGFTLLEVLTVMAVAGILMLTMVPRVDVSRFQLDAAMREVGSAVATARGRALSSRSGRWFTAAAYFEMLTPQN